MRPTSLIQRFLLPEEIANMVAYLASPKAAWRDKPAYGIVATEDKSIAPEIERNMYQRSKTKITEIKGSHVVFISQPKAVADFIITASKTRK